MTYGYMEPVAGPDIYIDVPSGGWEPEEGAEEVVIFQGNVRVCRLGVAEYPKIVKQLCGLLGAGHEMTLTGVRIRTPPYGNGEAGRIIFRLPSNPTFLALDVDSSVWLDGEEIPRSRLPDALWEWLLLAMDSMTALSHSGGWHEES